MPLGLTTTVGENVIGALKIRNDYGAFSILLLVKLLFLIFLALFWVLLLSSFTLFPFIFIVLPTAAIAIVVVLSHS